jgi:diphthamide synthase (EF-2-diphthine--ammonia ligase)
MPQLNNQIGEIEMTFDELEQVSGGDILNRMIDQYMAALGARLLADVHAPLVQPTPISLHMR